MNELSKDVLIDTYNIVYTLQIPHPPRIKSFSDATGKQIVQIKDNTESHSNSLEP